jgi:Ca2+-binding RTX toxin-like protein
MPLFFVQRSLNGEQFNTVADLNNATVQNVFVSDRTAEFLDDQGAFGAKLGFRDIATALNAGGIVAAVADRLDLAHYLVNLDADFRIQVYYEGKGFGDFLDSTELLAEFGLVSFEYATTRNELLEGDSGANFLITGAGGNDTLLGKAGDDVLSLFKGSFGELSGGTGDDTLYGSDFDDLLKGGKDEDEIIGAGGNDIIRGQSHADWMSGGNGDDNIKGGGGNDTLYGDGGDDFLKGGTRRDLIDGGDGDDVLVGNSFNDTLIGGAGDDKLLGGGDDDRLEAGTGADTLKGGDGADVFVFVNEAQAGTRNLVTDFDLAEDRLEIASDALPGADAAALVAAAQITGQGVLLTLDQGEILLQGMTSTAGLADVIDITPSLDPIDIGGISDVLPL